MSVPIYYINLASRPDRRAFMEEQFARLGLQADRIEAVTPNDIPADDLALHCDNTRPVHLRPGQLACSMSHEKAWRTMLASGQERAVVLEDDATLSDLLPAFLESIDQIDFDVLRFERPSRKVRVLPAVAHTGPGIALRPFRSTLAGRSGYIISSKAAKAFLEHPAMRRLGGDRVVNGALATPNLRLVRYLTDPGYVCSLETRERTRFDRASAEVTSTGQWQGTSSPEITLSNISSCARPKSLRAPFGVHSIMLLTFQRAFRRKASFFVQDKKRG